MGHNLLFYVVTISIAMVRVMAFVIKITCVCVYFE